MSDNYHETGGCLCGAVRYEVTSPPITVEHCHCMQCRKASGAPFVTWADFSVNSFKWTKGKPQYFQSSELAKRGFCEKCGTSIEFKHIEPVDYICITAGSLDNPEAVKPNKHIHSKSQISWANVGEDLPKSE